jgi:hypothetical protein
VRRAWTGIAGFLAGVGAVAVALLFIGLHNAWGIVPYVALQRLQGRAQR